MDASQTSPAVLRHRLKNGMTVLVEPLHHAPVVALQAWVGVGAADENKDRASGLAHLHEHMLFKGTERRAVGEVARSVEAVGGEMNAWTSFDETVYHLVLAEGSLDLGVDLLADMLRNSVFDPEELGREIEVVLEEIKRAQDNPGRRLSQAMFAAAYQKHGYKDPVLGSAESVAATRRQDMLAFFHEHYRPDNVTLVVTGSVQPEEVLRCAERHFGDWQPHTVAPESSTAVPRVAEPRAPEARLRLLREDVTEARLALAFAGLAAKDANTAALDLFSVLLGSGESSRLHQALVRPRHLLGAYASAYTPKDPGLFILGATLQTPKPSAAEALEAVGHLRQEAHRLAERGPEAQELEKARTMVLSDAAYSKETMEGQARKRGFFEATCGSWSHEAKYTAAIEAMTPQEICAVAKTVLQGQPTLVLQVPQDGSEDVAQLGAQDVAAANARARAKVLAQARRVHAPLNRERKVNFGPLGVVRLQVPNGPTLLVQPTAGQVVAMRVAALGGLRGETPLTAGTATLLANCLGQASQHVDADTLAARIAALGGGLSAFCGRNTLGLAAEFIAGRAADGLALAYQALWAPKFAEADVARERYGQLERIRSRADSPGGVAMDRFLAELYPQHPYGLPALGFAEVVKGIEAESLTELHQTTLSPEKAVVAICGPVDPAACLDQLAEALEGFGPGEPTTLQDALSRSKAAPQPVLDKAPQSARSLQQTLDKKQVHVIVGSQGTTLRHADRYALDVLSAALNGQSGRLFADLRDGQSLAYSLSCSSVEGVDPGHVMVHMACGPQKLQQALDGVHKHLRQLGETPLTAPELERAQQVLVGGHAIDLQRSGARAMTLATGELYGLGYDNYAAYPGHVMGITQADVMRVARHYLHAERLYDVVVGPVGEAPASTA